jgi:hypothetical protein
VVDPRDGTPGGALDPAGGQGPVEGAEAFDHLRGLQLGGKDQAAVAEAFVGCPTILADQMSRDGRHPTPLGARQVGGVPEAVGVVIHVVAQKLEMTQPGLPHQAIPSVFQGRFVGDQLHHFPFQTVRSLRNWEMSRM